MKRSDRSLAKEAARLAMLDRIAAERRLEAEHNFTGRRLDAKDARRIFASINTKPTFAPMRLKAVPPRASTTYRGHHRNARRKEIFDSRRVARDARWKSRGAPFARAA